MHQYPTRDRKSATKRRAASPKSTRLDNKRATGVAAAPSQSLVAMQGNGSVDNEMAKLRFLRINERVRTSNGVDMNDDTKLCDLLRTLTFAETLSAVDLHNVTSDTIKFILNKLRADNVQIVNKLSLGTIMNVSTHIIVELIDFAAQRGLCALDIRTIPLEILQPLPGTEAYGFNMEVALKDPDLTVTPQIVPLGFPENNRTVHYYKKVANILKKALGLYEVRVSWPAKNIMHGLSPDLPLVCDQDAKEDQSLTSVAVDDENVTSAADWFPAAAPVQTDDAFTMWRLKEVHSSFIGKGDGIKIAILDTGIDYTHSDLMSRIDNKKLDIYSCVDNEHPWIDPESHGTHCAGIIARVAPNAKLIIGKVLSNSGKGNIKSIIDGIKQAVDRGAHIISLSLSVSNYDTNLFNTILAAQQRGVVIVAAANNSSVSKSPVIRYPACFGEVICVGSHDLNWNQSKFSCVGQQMDFLAPGDSVYSNVSYLYNRTRFAYMRGTSMATPFVAGLAALICGYAQLITKNKDLRLNSFQMREIIRKMSHNGTNHNIQSGYGYIEPMEYIKSTEEPLKRTLRELGII